MNPEWNSIIEQAVTDASRDIEDNYETDESQLLLVDPEIRNSKFGAGSDGGWGAEVFTTLSYVVATGNEPANPKAAGEVTLADCKVWEAAAACHAKDLEALGLDPKTVSYSDIEAKDDALAELVAYAQDELYHDEDISFRIGAFYYKPDNQNLSHPARGQHGMYVFGAVVLSGAFLGDKLITYYEANFAFDGSESLRTQLEEHLRLIAQEETNVEGDNP